VYVFRQPRPPEVLKKERDEAQAEARQCQEDKARLLAEREEPGGLVGAAWLEGAGVVASKKLDFLTEQPANALRLEKARSYSYTPTGETHPASVAVRLLLKNPGAEPWTLAGAALVDSAGIRWSLPVGHWRPSPRMVPVPSWWASRGSAQLGCPCTLKLWEAQGPRTFTLGNVTFPEGKAKGP
jgi:hypothetical protein